MKKTPINTILDDPIVNEVRHAGQVLFRDAGHDIHRLCALLKKREPHYANPVQMPCAGSMTGDLSQTVQTVREDEAPYE